MTRATTRIPRTSPLADPAQVVTGPNWRITVLTPRLLRLEWSEDGVFEDRPTQVVWHRCLPPAPFQVTRTGEGLKLTTEALQLDYDGARFTPGGLVVRQLVNADNHSQWHYGLPTEVGPREPAWPQGNLGGTARTLDEADGAVPLEPGLLATRGCTTLDDSVSLALDANGWPTPRVGDVDLYLFGHGHDAQGALDDFYAITGPTPLLPRWALGNWWSRYHAYSAEEYLGLMDRFAAEEIPFSVAVVDMDWHWVDIPAGLGPGWTGFSFNTDLFRDPEAFLAGLHERGLTASLNLHPADGVRRHEDAYPRLAARLGLDPSLGEAIGFTVDDPKFMRAYFEEVLHPLEEAGVDFWWLDWQQGSASGMPGLDPLWLLNHVHFLDSARTGRRPITFSRYAGPGSHRYPVGFSGDTITTWESLHFQPYFTATASNIGYGWWSHDLGGHMMGERDDEMVARWLQLGVWSPIMRLHSSSSPFTGKEPWNYGARAAAVMVDSLRLRHRLLPYLYTMNERAHTAGVPLVRPLYWEDPRAETVLTSSGTFLFGSELLVAPLTGPADRRTGCARVRTWLPQGTWTDWYSGLRYSGGRFVEFGRPLETYPVLARAGAIVPLTGGDDLGVANPSALHVRVFAGADGSFELYEDDDAADPVVARTLLRWEQATGTFTIAPVAGDVSVLPADRRWTVAITGVAPAPVPGVATSYDPRSGTLTLDLGVLDPARGRVVRFTEPPRPSEANIDARVFALLQQLQVGYDDKHTLWDLLTRTPSLTGRLAALAALPVADDVKRAVTELLTAEV